MPARSSRYDYLLGDSRTESARLRRQAELWDPVSHALFDRLRIRPGLRVLEIGPGRGSLHAELRRRLRGPADAVEHSATFASALASACARDGLGEGTIWQCALADAALPPSHYDVIFARWVFLFLPDVPGHLKQLVRALKPGGRLAVQDYLRDTLSMVPRPRDWDALVAADRAFFATQGGDSNVGAHLPTLARAAGLVVEEASPTIKLGPPGSREWRWMSDYVLGVMNRYAALGPLSRPAAARLRREWLAAARERTSVVVAPAVLDVVARKKRAIVA
jgi:SAM-dependent methyltransferase